MSDLPVFRAECRMRYNPFTNKVDVTLLNEGGAIRNGHTLLVNVEEWREIVRRVEAELPPSQDKGTDR